MDTWGQWRFINISVLQPPVKSIRVEDIFKAIESDIIVMKIDIEGYECKVTFHELLICAKNVKYWRLNFEGTAARNPEEWIRKIHTIHLYRMDSPEECSKLSSVRGLGEHLLWGRILPGKPRFMLLAINISFLTFSKLLQVIRRRRTWTQWKLSDGLTYYGYIILSIWMCKCNRFQIHFVKWKYLTSLRWSIKHNKKTLLLKD